MIAIPRKKKYDVEYAKTVKQMVREMKCKDVKLPIGEKGETVCVDPILTIYIAHSTS